MRFLNFCPILFILILSTSSSASNFMPGQKIAITKEIPLVLDTSGDDSEADQNDDLSKCYLQSGVAYFQDASAVPFEELDLDKLYCQIKGSMATGGNCKETKREKLGVLPFAGIIRRSVIDCGTESIGGHGVAPTGAIVCKVSILDIEPQGGYLSKSNQLECRSPNGPVKLEQITKATGGVVLFSK